jgi:hypothetical protein
MSSLAEFKAAIDIVETAAMLTEIRRSGATAVMLCPFHDDRNPSLYLYPDTASFYCFVCKESGDVIALAGQMRGTSFNETLDWLAEVHGIDRPARSPEQEAFAATMRRVTRALAEGREAVGEDIPFGLTREQAAELGLGITDELAEALHGPSSLMTSDEVEEWNGHWLLPLHRRGGPVGFGALLDLDADGGGFHASNRLRGPALAALNVARSLITRHRAVIYSSSMSQMLRLQAAGHAGVVSAGDWPSAEVATLCAELAPRVLLVLTPQQVRDNRLLPSLFMLQQTGVSVDVLRLLEADGELELKPAISAFEFLARLTPRMEKIDAHYCWDQFLESISSATARELYRQEVDARQLRT